MTTDEKVEQLISILQDVSFQLSSLSTNVSFGGERYLVASDIDNIRTTIDSGLGKIGYGGRKHKVFFG